MSSSKYRSNITRRGGGAVEQRNIRGRRFDQNRRREIARIAGVQGCVFERPVSKAQAWAQLIGIDELLKFRDVCVSSA